PVDGMHVARRGRGGVGKRDPVAGALVAEVSERVRVPMTLKPSIRDLGQVEGWPLVVVLAGDQQDRSPRALDRNRGSLDGVPVSEHRQVDGPLDDRRALLVDGRPVDRPVVLTEVGERATSMGPRGAWAVVAGLR